MLIEYTMKQYIFYITFLITRTECKCYNTVIKHFLKNETTLLKTYKNKSELLYQKYIRSIVDIVCNTEIYNLLIDCFSTIQLYIKVFNDLLTVDLIKIYNTGQNKYVSTTIFNKIKFLKFSDRALNQFMKEYDRLYDQFLKNTTEKHFILEDEINYLLSLNDKLSHNFYKNKNYFIKKAKYSKRFLNINYKIFINKTTPLIKNLILGVQKKYDQIKLASILLLDVYNSIFPSSNETLIDDAITKIIGFGDNLLLLYKNIEKNFDNKVKVPIMKIDQILGILLKYELKLRNLQYNIL